MLTPPWTMTGVWSTADPIEATNQPMVTHGASTTAAATWIARAKVRLMPA